MTKIDVYRLWKKWLDATDKANHAFMAYKAKSREQTRTWNNYTAERAVYLQEKQNNG